MKIEVTCAAHPGATVYLLDGTVKFQTRSGAYVEEKSERASFVLIDEANLYCTVPAPRHHFLLYNVTE